MSTGRDSEPRPRPALVSVALFAGYLVLAFALFLPAWRDPFHRLIGIPGDNQQFAWFLAWPAFAIPHAQNPLITTYIDWPSGVNLMWNTSIVLPATLLAPLTGWLGPVFAYNLLVTAAPALSALTGSMFIRRFVPSHVGAAVGGLLYGFSPFVLAESLAHPMLSLAVLPPLILLAVDDIVRGHRPVVLSGLLLGLLSAAQLLVSEEMLAATALTAALLLSLVSALHPERLKAGAGRLAKGGAVAAVTFTVLAGYPLAVQFFGPLRLSGVLHPPNTFVNDVLSFVVPSRNQWLAPAALRGLGDGFIGGRLQEIGSFIGIPLLALLGFITVRFWDDLRVRLAALAASVLTIWSLGYSLHVANHTSRLPVVLLALAFPPLQRFLPGWFLLVATAAGWLLLDRAPLLRQVLPSRLSVFLYLFAGVLLAIFIERMAVTIGWPRWATGVIVALALLPLLPSLPFPTAAPPLPAFFTPANAGRRLPQDSVVLIAPFARLHDPFAMLWQASAGIRFRMPEGYAFAPSSDVDQLNPPPSFTRTLLSAVEAGAHPGSLSDAERGQLQADLRRWRVDAIVVGPMSHEPEMVALVTQLLGEPPQATQGVDLWSNVLPGSSG